MVQSVLNIVYREVRGLHQAAYVLALFTFLSQVLALIRDRLLAHEFGAGIELDLYYTAFRIPDVLYVLFASTLSVYVLIPFITERAEGEGNASARQLLSQIFSLFLIAYAAIAALAMVFAPSIVGYLFPGFIGEKETLVTLTRILLLQPLFLGISSLLSVITQIEHRFTLYAVSPLIYNVFIILGLLLLYPVIGVTGLAIGVVLGAIGHLCIQIPFILRSPIRPGFTASFDMQSILAVFRVSLTRALTLSLHQLVLLGLVGVASVMAAGSVSIFQFAFNLQSVPLAIIGVSYSVAAFPLLAQLYAEKRFDAFAESIVNTLRHILFWSLPAIALFVVIRAQFVRVVLGSGEFDWGDTRLTAAALAIFVLSLAAQAIHLLLVRALYAAGNTRTPFFVTLFSSVLALLFAPVFFALITENSTVRDVLAELMRLEGVSGIEVLALPIAYSTALLLHGVVLLVLSRKHLRLSIRGLIRPLTTSALAALFGGYVAYSTLNLFAAGYETNTLLTVFMQGLAAGVAGLSGTILIHYALRSRELSDIAETLKKKLLKRDVAVPQDEDTLAV